MRCGIVAELASNHGGDIDLACEMVRQCAEAGADTVKFQSFTVAHLAPTDPQYEWFHRSELSDAAHERLLRCCEDHRVRFLTTAFHEDRIPFLASLGLDTIKIGSGEAMKRALIDAVAAHPWRVYLSTGLATVQEIAYAVKVLGGRLTLFHCVSQYPTPLDQVNLCRISWLRERFGVRVGYSDHTTGLDACRAAMAVGAEVVEKHFSVFGGPRAQEWDMWSGSLAKLCEFRETLAKMTTLRPMGNVAQGRPYVGRWSAR